MTREAQDNLQFPLPEALRLGRGGAWDVLGIGTKRACCDVVEHKMQVPLDSSTSSRAVRAHEMGHAQWSPLTSPQLVAEKLHIPQVVLQSLEDARINSNLQRCGIDLSDGMCSDSELSQAVFMLSTAVDPQHKLALAASLLVACIGVERDYREAQALIRNLDMPEAVEIAIKVRTVLERTPGFIPFRRAIEASEYLLDLVLPPREEEPEEVLVTVTGIAVPTEGMTREEAAADAEKNADLGDTSKDVTPKDAPVKRMAPKETPKPVRKEKRRREVLRKKLIHKFSPVPAELRDKPMGEVSPIRMIAGAPAVSPRPPAWGKLIIETPSLPRKYREQHGNRAKSDSDFGLDLLHVERAYEDGQIFRVVSAGRRRGGAVLIDVSGSMALTNANLQAIIKALPLSIVAVYAGRHDDGILRIVARRGSMIDTSMFSRPGDGANVIDGPALEWLSTQAQPRYWYSDGYVTGIGEQQNSQLVDDAQNIVIRSNIRRVTTINQITSRSRGTHRVPYSFLDRRYCGYDEEHDTDDQSFLDIYTL